MKLKINGVRDIGALEKERVVLSVSEDTQLGTFAITAIHSEDETDAFNIKFGYWFPNKRIKKNDTVVLYTKLGTMKSRTHDSGSTSHFFYLNRNETAWNNEWILGLFSMDEWDYHAPMPRFLEEVETEE